MTQHVKEPTHIKGSTLDMVITKEKDEELIKEVKVKDRITNSDHHPIVKRINLDTKPEPQNKQLHTETKDHSRQMISKKP